MRNSLRGAWLALALPLAAAAQQPADTTRADTTAARDTTSVTLVREVFAYEGAGRDPFMSLLRSGDVRPLISDLRLVTVIYDPTYPARSVAVLRDITTNRNYRVKPGDIIGRLRASQIRPREVVFTVQEFGYDRQETLTLARQEVSP